MKSPGWSEPPPTPQAADAPTACPACRSASIVTTSKIPDAESYWRCQTCGEIWNVSRSRERPNQPGAYRWP